MTGIIFNIIFCSVTFTRKIYVKTTNCIRIIKMCAEKKKAYPYYM